MESHLLHVDLLLLQLHWRWLVLQNKVLSYDSLWYFRQASVLDYHVCVVWTYSLEVAFCHFSWEVLGIDKVHLVEQCLKDFSLNAIQFSLAYSSCCVDAGICLLLLSRLIGLWIIINFAVLLHLLGLFKQNAINTKDHTFFDNESHLMLIDLAIFIMCLVLLHNSVLHFLVSLQQNHSFLYEKDVSGWIMKIVNNFFSLVSAKGHAAC